MPSLKLSKVHQSESTCGNSEAGVNTINLDALVFKAFRSVFNPLC